MSSPKTDKTTTLKEAIRELVHDGDHISFGGFTINRNPMAAVHEITRQHIKDLHIYAHSNGQALDELIGAGLVSKIEIAYSGNGRFAPTCLCFKRAVIEKKIKIEDYTNFQMVLRFMAGSMGIPYLPTSSSLGTDIVKKWGFPKDFRLPDDKIALKKLVVADNPFSRSEIPEKLVLVPAIQTDVTLLHVQTADTKGTCRIKGLTFSDIEQAKASKRVIITCEELVEPGVLNQDPGANQLPSFCVHAVVKVPYGAYPTACYGAYDYDATFLDQYREMAQTDQAFKSYVSDYILGTKSHAEFVEKACGQRLEQLKADPETGYSNQIKRK